MTLRIAIPIKLPLGLKRFDEMLMSVTSLALSGERNNKLNESALEKLN